jgi:hypothetical protein
VVQRRDHSYMYIQSRPYLIVRVYLRPLHLLRRCNFRCPTLLYSTSLTCLLNTTTIQCLPIPLQKSPKQILNFFEKRGRSAKASAKTIALNPKVQRSNLDCMFHLMYTQFEVARGHEQPGCKPIYHGSILADHSDRSVTVSSPTKTA